MRIIVQQDASEERDFATCMRPTAESTSKPVPWVSQAETEEYLGLVYLSCVYNLFVHEHLENTEDHETGV